MKDEKCLTHATDEKKYCLDQNKSLEEVRNEYLEELSKLNQITLNYDIDENIKSEILDIVESLLCYNEVLLYSEYMDLSMKKIPKWIITLFDKLFFKEINEEYGIH